VSQDDPLKHGYEADTDRVERFDTEIVSSCCIKEQGERGVEIALLPPVADEEGNLGQGVYGDRDVALGAILDQLPAEDIDYEFKKIGMDIDQFFQRFLASLAKEPSPVGSAVQFLEQDPPSRGPNTCGPLLRLFF